jgi:hypothetical protein
MTLVPDVVFKVENRLSEAPPFLNATGTFSGANQWYRLGAT